MLLEKDELKEGLSPEQIQAIENVYSEKEKELTALANKNADGIFNGAAEKLTKLTGIQKEEKEKFSDYFERLGNEWLPEATKTKAEKEIEEAKRKAQEWEEKFKNHKGDETLKQELERLQSEVKKIPDLLAGKENEWKTKYETLENEHNSYKFDRAITDSMPKFDENINPFELKAKKQSAIDRLRQDYELSFDDKSNLIATKDYQKHLVSDLLKSDSELKELVLTDQGSGGGGGGKPPKPTTGLNLPQNISKGAAQNLIEEYIIEVEKIGKLDDKFPERYKELLKENSVL